MKEEKKEYIAEVLEEIDDEYIAEAAVSKGQIINFCWKHWMTAASVCACLLIVALFVWNLPFSSMDVGKTGEDAQTQTDGKGVTIPEVKVSLSKNSEKDHYMCMIPFVIYQGGVYLENANIPVDHVPLRDYLGHATGPINEWTPDDGYIDFASSAEGDIYAVEGLDDSFAVAFIPYGEDGDGRSLLLFKDNGITLEKGSDLYEKRIHLAANYDSVQYQTLSAWYMEKEKEKKVLDVSYEDEISALVDALNEGAVMLRENVWEAQDMVEVLSNNMEFVLYFRLKSGIVIPLYVMRGGYVICSSMSDVCVKIPENIQEGIRMAPDSSAGSAKGSQAEDVGENEDAGENGSAKGNGSAEKGGQTEGAGNTGEKKNSSKTDDQAKASGQSNEKGKEEQEKTEDVCWIQKTAELEEGRESTVCLYARSDYSRPYVVIREGETEQKISLGKSKNLWYHDLQHSEIVVEHDFDGDGTKEILVLFRQGAASVLSEFRMLKRNGSGNWKVFTLPEQLDLAQSEAYVTINVTDNSTVQLKVPATGYKTKLDMSKHPGLASYFAEEGKKAIMYNHFVSIVWDGTELVIVYYLSARNAWDEVGVINQKVLWDNAKSCFVLGETWYEETEWDYPD